VTVPIIPHGSCRAVCGGGLRVRAVADGRASSTCHPANSTFDAGSATRLRTGRATDSGVGVESLRSDR
jgi:hypothetical protein